MVYWSVDNEGNSEGLNTQVIPAALPCAITGLQATALSHTQIKLTWNAASGATSYNVFRGSAAGTYHAYVGSSILNSFTDAGLSPNTSYNYIVVSVNSAGNGPKSGEASATTPLGLPGALTNVVTTGVTISQINVTWASASGATSYNIFRSATPGGYHAYIGSSSTTSFSNTGLATGETYYYIVVGVNSVGSGAKSAEAPGTTLTP